MKNIFFALLCLMGFQLNAQETPQIPNSPCATDKDCVLFEDECTMLISVPKEKLPAGTTSLKKKDVGYFAWAESEMPKCTRHFFVKPEWPLNPIAKCLKNECLVDTKPPVPKKRTQRPSAGK